MTSRVSTNNEPLKPEWPENVMVFNPTDCAVDIKPKIKPSEDPIRKYTDAGEEKETYHSAHHFSTKHYALLFAPGEYKDCKFEVGYYVQIAGLGKTAKGEGAVKFTGKDSGPFIPALNKDLDSTRHIWNQADPITRHGLCLDTFWRSAENFSSENTQWAVSQAAPLRRVHVSNDLTFGDGAAYASGGFLANAEVGGTCDFVANQQWISRSVDFQGEVQGGAWSLVFSGCTGNVPIPDVPVPNNDLLCMTVEEKPDVRVEKPYIVMNSERNYELHIPNFTTDAVTGSHLAGSDTTVRSFSAVKVCKPILPLDGEGKYADHDDATYNDISQADIDLTAEMQQALDEGKDLVLCPGVFFLTKPLVVKKLNQVILGLGVPVLVAPQDGSPCVRVMAKTPGVRIAGITLEASLQVVSEDSSNLNSDGVRSLLDFREPGVVDYGDSTNPGVMSDLFTRVGGSNLERRKVSTDVMVRVHSGNVVGDNLWLWRADHVRQQPDEEINFDGLIYPQVRIWEENEDGVKTRIDECIAKNALEVSGNDVKMYGLFCEHTTEHQMVWKGERGSVTFFQCELPYCVDVDFADNEYTGYYVDENVDVHTARGVGVYTNFQVYDVHPERGISVPPKEGITLSNPYTRFLDNRGGIQNVVKVGEKLVGKSVKKENPEVEKLSRAWFGTKSAAAIAIDNSISVVDK